jgi:hypothetical protein
VLTLGAWTYLLVESGLYMIPVLNIATETREIYTKFRPVRFGFKKLRYGCARSGFWFEKKP